MAEEASLFVPFLLSHSYRDSAALGLVVGGFLALGCIASGTYLINDLSDLGAFDIVMCSHVLSTFESAAAAATLDRLESVCRDDGLIVFGANESVSPPAAFASTPTPGVWRRSSAFPRALSAG